jgi:hypothetical protein
LQSAGPASAVELAWFELGFGFAVRPIVGCRLACHAGYYSSQQYYAVDRLIKWVMVKKTINGYKPTETQNVAFIKYNKQTKHRQTQTKINRKLL